MNAIAEEILSYLGYADTLEPPEAIDISESMLHSSTNPVADEIASYFGIAEKAEEDLYLKHYGMPRRSGRYPYIRGKSLPAWTRLSRAYC